MSKDKGRLDNSLVRPRSGRLELQGSSSLPVPTPSSEIGADAAGMAVAALRPGRPMVMLQPTPSRFSGIAAHLNARPPGPANWNGIDGATDVWDPEAAWPGETLRRFRTLMFNVSCRIRSAVSPAASADAMAADTPPPPATPCGS